MSMSRLSGVRLVPPAAAQRRRLAGWLGEWQAERLLRAGAEEARHTDEGAAGGRESPRWPTIGREPSRYRSPVPGDVYLLYPAPASPAAFRAIYTAVLEKRSGARLCIAPFSRFAVPALPGEWRTGIKAVPLCVLCVWNARAVGAGIFARCWRVGRLPPPKVRLALAIHRSLRGGAPPPAALERDLGPPLRHPLDPRLTYQAEEATEFDEALAAFTALESPRVKERQTSGSLYDPGVQDRLLAAESPEAYGGTRGLKRTKSRTDTESQRH
jgi:hypothetical protein